MMQIAMFLTLGLQVFPSRLMEVAGSGLAIASFLMCVARPGAVMATLLPTALTLRERMPVGWVGLRGAAPIVLATFPLVARVPNAQFIFDLIFFVVVTSGLIQGTTVSWVARRLRLSALAGTGGTVDPLDLVAAGDRDIVEFRVNAGSQAAGRRLLDLGLPHGALVVLIQRGDHSFVPTGGSMFKPAIDCQFSQISLSVRSSRPSLTCNRGRFAQDRVWAS
jgi:potassium/hydrogen antiporter